ncbi:MAG: EamA family transporter [Chloroflexi bacterium]|nr:EamA family transporter [Chloroflexota bacterium]
MSERFTSRNMGVAMVVVATVCWSTAGLWVKLIVEGSQISAVALAFWRDLATFVLLLGGVALLRPSLLRVKKRDLPYLAIMGAVGIGAFHALWNFSVIFNGIAIATVLQYNAPIIVTLAAYLLWREPLTWQKLAAIALALSGTALIALSGGSSSSISVTPIGILVGLTSAFAISTFSLLGKRLAGDYSPWTVVTYVFGFASAAILPFYLAGDTSLNLSWPVVAAFAGFVFVPTLSGFSLYTASLQRLQVSVASILATTEVPLAAAIGFVILGERFSLVQILGAALVILGVLFVSIPQAKWPTLLQRLRSPII